MPHARQHVPHTRALAAAAAVLVVFAFLPVRYGTWVNQLQKVPALAIGPSRWLFRSVGQVFVRPSRGADAEQLRALENDRDQWKSRALAVEEQLRETTRRLAQFEAGQITPEPGIRALRARVTGPTGPPGTQMLALRAGTSHGVARGTVAVTERVQVVGRVERVGLGSSTLVLITQPEQPPIGGRILLDASPDAKEPGELRTQLYAQPDGSLRGQVEYQPARPGEPAREPRVGQTVYLSDPSWPESARMLVLGTISDARPVLDSPLRRLITVTPTVQLDRLTEVTLRIPPDDAPAAPGGGP